MSIRSGVRDSLRRVLLYDVLELVTGQRRRDDGHRLAIAAAFAPTLATAFAAPFAAPLAFAGCALSGLGGKLPLLFDGLATELLVLGSGRFWGQVGMLQPTFLMDVSPALAVGAHLHGFRLPACWPPRPSTVGGLGPRKAGFPKQLDCG